MMQTSIFALAVAFMLLLSCDGAGCPGVNQASINLIKEFEGFVPSPSPDPIGLPTVGYGHRCKSRGCSEVPFKFPLTRSNAEALLVKDILPITACLDSCIDNRIRLNDDQWGALASWTLNVGCSAIKSSSLIKRLNAGQNPNTVAAQELRQWDTAGGKILPGLVHRRAAEVKLFQTPSSHESHPSCF